MKKFKVSLYKRLVRFTHLNLVLVVLVLWLSSHILFISLCTSAWGIVLTDAGCVDCHVLPTNAINVALTHPNLIAGCVTCHSPETLGFHKNGIRELDPLFYNYTGTAVNDGCNVCHGAPPQAICVGGIVMDHCLDPAGCNPVIFDCVLCHLNFNGTPAHIYPKILGVPPFAPIASTAQCLVCHGMSLLVGRSGAHATHFITQLMAPPTTSSFAVSIGCAVCHPDLSTLGADHITCLPGTSNAWLPGQVPVTFDPLLPQVGIADHYLPGLLGGSGTCYVYCHSNGATPPTILTAALGYPGSNLPLPWNIPFPIDPITLNCGCCHTFPPVTHSAAKGDCSQCHPTPLIGAAPTNAYHINGIPDLWKSVAAASPMIPLILPPTLSQSSVTNDTILTSALGLTGSGVNGLLGLTNNGSMLSETYNPVLALLSTFGMLDILHNPFLSLSLANNTAFHSITIGDDSVSPFGFMNTSGLLPGYHFGIPGLSQDLTLKLINPLANYSLPNFSPLSNLYTLGAFSHIHNPVLNFTPWEYNQPLHFLSPNNFWGMPAFMNLSNPFLPFGGLRQPLYW